MQAGHSGLVRTRDLLAFIISAHKLQSSLTLDSVTSRQAVIKKKWRYKLICPNRPFLKTAFRNNPSLIVDIPTAMYSCVTIIVAFYIFPLIVSYIFHHIILCM